MQAEFRSQKHARSSTRIRLSLTALQRMCAVAAGTFLVSHGVLPRGAAAKPVPQAEEAFFSSLKVEDVEQRLPSFTIQEKEFSAIIHKKRLLWPAEARHRFDPDADETSEWIEILDASGTSVFTEGKDAGIKDSDLQEIHRDGRFVFSDSYSVSRIQGDHNQALVIGLSTLPSAPSSCTRFRILGLFEGRLVPLSEPFCENVIHGKAASGSDTWKLTRDSQNGFEVFRIRRNYGFFEVIIPIRVDFLLARLLPGRWCIRLGAATMTEYCEFPVEAQRRPAEEESYVRLFSEPDETLTPRHIVVKPQSRIAFLTALAPNAMDRTGHWRTDSDTRLLWLKVRIDETEGWVREEEDLNALGLFRAG